MNESIGIRIGRRALLAGALAVAACSPGEEVPVQGARIGGPFALTDQNGRTVRDSDFAGRYRLIYFGYTYCPDACPADLLVIGDALKRFEQQAPQRARRVQPIFITVDPARDTPPVLKEYVANFHPRLIGLTGTEQQIEQVRSEFGIAVSDRGDFIEHPRAALLFGPDGRPIALIPPDPKVEAMAETLDRWVK